MEGMEGKKEVWEKVAAVEITKRDNKLIARRDITNWKVKNINLDWFGDDKERDAWIENKERVYLYFVIPKRK
jgi:hypothetical protein